MSTGVIYYCQKDFAYQPYEVPEDSEFSAFNCCDFITQAQHSIKTLHEHCSLPVTVFTDVPEEFEHIDNVTAVRHHGRWKQCVDKIEVYILSPYENTIYLDCDTEVLADPSTVFDSYPNEVMVCREILSKREQQEWVGYADEFNAGIIFYRRRPEVMRWLVAGVLSTEATLSTSGGEFFPGGDQKMLNTLLDQGYKDRLDIKYIPSKWNIRVPIYNIIKDKKIIHSRGLYDKEMKKAFLDVCDSWSQPSIELLELNN